MGMSVAKVSEKDRAGQRTYYPEVDILKGIAIVLVALGHAIILYPVNLHAVLWTSKIYEWVESVHMPLFFLVSGFCFSFHGRESASAPEKAQGFFFVYAFYLGKKVRRILIPYLTFCTADILARLCFPFFVNDKEKTFLRNIYDMFFGGGGYWFLYVLFFLFLLAPFWHTAAKRCRALLPLFLALSLCAPFLPGIPEIFLLRLTAHYLPYFYVGTRIRAHFPALKGLYDRRRLTPRGFLFLTAALLALWIVLLQINGTDIHTVLYMTVAFLGCFCFWCLLQSGLLSRLYPALKEMGVYSLQLYLFNSYLLVISRSFICRFFSYEGAGIILLFNLVFDLGVAYLIIRAVVVKVPLFRKLCGLL